MRFFSSLQTVITVALALTFSASTAHSMGLPSRSHSDSVAFSATTSKVATRTTHALGGSVVKPFSSGWKLVYSGSWFVAVIQLAILKGPNHDSSAYMKRNGRFWEVWSQHWS